jgi:hypothetical protein
MVPDGAEVWRYNSRARMRRVAIAYVVAVVILRGSAAYAQDQPPLPRFVVDLHGVAPVFPNDATQLAQSRPVLDPSRPPPAILSVSELPGAGLGGRIGAHVYVFTYKKITAGVGGEVMLGTSSSTPAEGTTGLVSVNERLRVLSSQVSVNFGSGHGWSFLSGGVGRSVWSVRPAGQAETPADTESLPTFNYGGGARWFAKKHFAFSLDVRIYEIQAGSSFGGRPGSPRTRLWTVGAGISLK